MAAYDKGTPSAVRRLIDGPLQLNHRDGAFAGPSSAASASTSSAAFRSRPLGSSSTPDDFGRFASASQTVIPNYDHQGSTDRGNEAVAGVAGTRPQGGGRGADQDGFEVDALLRGELLADAVDGDWETELFEKHRATAVHDSTLPRDPLVSSASTSKGKGKAAVPGQRPAGDLSPTSESLLSSLSSLDLSTKAYLRTLLAQSPERAVEAYFEQSQYTDDVWGLPTEVRGVFESARANSETPGQAEGREKAIRRLGMLMKHLDLTDASASASVETSARSTDSRSDAGTTRDLDAGTRAAKSPAERARDEWLQEWAEHPIAAGHVRTPPLEVFERNLGPIHLASPMSPVVRKTDDSPASAGANWSHRGSQSYSVPSSLDPSVYVTHHTHDEGELPV
ncbi:hypothetical protein JCM10212_003953 [Sporobolomyces blumeae]